MASTKDEDAQMKDAEAAAGEGAAPAAEGAAPAGDEAAAEGEAEAEAEKPKEPEKPKELEQDAPEDSRGKITEAVKFLTEDTSINVMPTVNGKVLMGLSEGGFQYLLAGARANVGLKSGRYAFEVSILECKNLSEPQGAKGRSPAPRVLVRVGLATTNSSLFLSDGLESVCFDSEGSFAVGKMKQRVSQKFGQNQVVACVVNLDQSSPNANTLSLFKNGVRICQPQAIPESLRGKTLYPAVAFRNVSLKVNFGPRLLRPLPFACTPLALAAAADCELKTPLVANGGPREVVFPIGLPDEGTFDWLDQFLAKNKGYTEISDRALIDWAKKSGLQKQGGGNKWASNDKPDFNFGLPLMDDNSVHKVLAAIAPGLDRNYVVMEVRSNLLADDRKEAMARFPGFKKVAQVVVGEPPDEYKKELQAAILAEKKEAERKKIQAKKAEAARKQAEEARKKKAEEDRKKRIEAAKKAKEKKDGEEKAEEKAEEKEAEEAPKEEEVAKEEEKEDDIVVELTEEEKNLTFRKRGTPDLAQKALAASYASFTLPAADEGFDSIQYAWLQGDECAAYMKKWVSERKLTQRVEDLKPSEWFQGKWSEWSKLVATWKKKQSEWKAVLRQLKDWIDDADPKSKAVALAKKKAEDLKRKKQKTEKAEKKEGEEAEEPAAEPDPAEEPKPMDVNAEDLDVFAVEDVSDIGNGEPLFANFVFEDWTLLSLRFELHLLVHAFKHDLADPERPTFHERHLGFYYNKYFKKPFNLKYFGVEKLADLIEMIKDTVEISSRNSTLESQMSEDTPMDNFVKLTEDHRRDRERRLDAGDETAQLKFTKPAPAPSPAGRSGGKGEGKAQGKAQRSAPASRDTRPPPLPQRRGGSGGYQGGNSSRPSGQSSYGSQKRPWSQTSQPAYGSSKGGSSYGSRGGGYGGGGGGYSGGGGYRR